MIFDGGTQCDHACGVVVGFHAMQAESNPPSTTIVTPLAFEAIRIQTTARQNGWPLLVCGPGRGGIERMAGRCRIPEGHVVILAGIAGGLNPELETGHSLVADAVIDEAGLQRVPPLRLDKQGGVICTCDSLCSTPEAKARLRDGTGADAVDMESIYFAKLAEERGWKWGVIRGISDDCSSSLPSNCSTWMDAGGRTRPWKIIQSILADPKISVQLPGLQRSATRAMQAVGASLVQLLASEHASA